MHTYTAEHLHPVPQPGDLLPPIIDVGEFIGIGDLVIIGDCPALDPIAGEVIEVLAHISYTRVRCVDGIVRSAAFEELTLIVKAGALEANALTTTGAVISA